jgi:peptidoglycan hydrolase FlgJ
MIRATESTDWSRQPPLPNLTANQQTTAADSFAKSLELQQTTDTTSEDPLKDAFRDFVGQTMFGQMLKSMRTTVGKPAYFHGGRGEEVFQEQLDQLLVEKISDSSASTVADPMYELFQLQRSQ